MNEHEVPSLDEETLAILRAEKEPPRAPTDVAARVLARLAVDLSGPLARSPAGTENVVGTSGIRGESTSSGFWLRGAFTRRARLFAAFVAGTVAGATGHAWLASSSKRNEVPPAPIVALREPAAEPVRSPPEPPTVPAPSEPANVVAEPVSSAVPADLRAERALLDQAQRALARGDASASLGVLTAHARRFPRGRLEEEREALAVKTLAALGRNEEAKVRGLRFRVRFPDSLLTSSIDDTLRSIP